MHVPELSLCVCWREKLTRAYITLHTSAEQ